MHSTSSISFRNEVYEQILLRQNQEIEQKTFKLEDMPIYVKKAEEYAGANTNLLERILTILNQTEFQTDQINYITEWKKSLIIKIDCDTKHDVLYETRKVDEAFDFFKKNFCWGVL